MIGFFDLPRELRDYVYEYYATLEGGYVLDPHRNKLRDKHGNAVDMALMHTCKRAVQELRAVALASNPITVSTFYSEEERDNAHRFDFSLELMHSHLAESIESLTPFMTDDIYDEVFELYPQFIPVLDAIRDGSGQSFFTDVGVGPCGEPYSVWTRFVRCLLQTISRQRGSFNDDFASFCRGRGRRFEKLIACDPVLWSIPTSEEVEEMLFILGPQRKGFDREFPYKFCYSAAAAAIRFLELTPEATRSEIRRIILDEDRRSVANPECHVLGMIPFCQRNPHLHVERRVSLWRNVFHRNSVSWFNWLDPFEDMKLNADGISHDVSMWVMEALTLQPAGMPPASFSLVLDGDSRCSEIFQAAVHRDVVWQLAMDECVKRGIFPARSWEDRRSNGYCSFNRFHRWYLFDEFPQAMRDIIDGNSVVRCNFDPGTPCDVDELVESNKTWDEHEWERGWSNLREQKRWQTAPPMPTWEALVRESVLWYRSEAEVFL